MTADGSAVLTKYEFAESERSARLLRHSYYSSPEQVKNREIDGASDQFSLASVLYEWIAGRRPFEGESLPAVLTQIISEPHKSLGEVLPGCAGELNEIVDRALNKRAASRYPSCKAFGEALQAFLQTLPRYSETLHAEVELRRAEVETGEQTLTSYGIPSMGGMNAAGQYEPNGEDERAHDYGNLLAWNGDLVRRFQALEARLKSGLTILQMLQQAQAELENRQYDACERTLRRLFQTSPDHAFGQRLLESCDDAQKTELRRSMFESALAYSLIRFEVRSSANNRRLACSGLKRFWSSNPATPKLLLFAKRRKGCLKPKAPGRNNGSTSSWKCAARVYAPATMTLPLRRAKNCLSFPRICERRWIFGRQENRSVEIRGEKLIDSRSARSISLVSDKRLLLN